MSNWLEGVPSDKYIYHYTSAKTFVEKILPSGELRLGPLRSTNDLYEYLDWPIEVSAGDCTNFDQGANKVWSVANFIKDSISLASFSCDESTCSNLHPERGYAIGPLWGNYAEKNTGVCLVLDRDSATSIIKDASADRAQVHSDKVDYATMRTPLDVCLPNDGNVDQNEVRKKLIENKKILLFRKHISWMCEQEYRIIAVCHKPTEVFVNIRKALAGVILGYKFDSCWLQEPCRLRGLLHLCEHVSKYNLYFTYTNPHLDDITEYLRDCLKSNMCKKLF